MPEYMVLHVQKHLTHLWRQHWSKSGPTEESIKANEHAALGQSTPVTARNKQDAEAKIKTMFPGDEVMSVETVSTRRIR